LAKEEKFQRVAGGLVIGCLQKRLLLSVEAFAKTLAVHRNTLEKSINESKEFLKITKADVDDFNKMTAGVEFGEEFDEIAQEHMQEEERSEAELHERVIRATSASTDARLVETRRALEQELLMVDEMIQIAQGVVMTKINASNSSFSGLKRICVQVSRLPVLRNGMNVDYLYLLSMRTHAVG